MDPLDVGGVLAEGLLKQDEEDADRAAIDADGAGRAPADADAAEAAAAEAAVLGGGGSGDGDEQKANADAAANTGQPSYLDAPHAPAPGPDVIPFVSLPMPEAEARALGPRAVERAHALSNAEAALLLSGFAQQERAANAAFEATPAAQRAARYAERMGGSRNADAVLRMRDVLAEAGLHDYEAVLVMNLAPETVDEALALVPSLREPAGRWDQSGGTEAAVEKVLADVAAYRAFD